MILSINTTAFWLKKKTKKSMLNANYIVYGKYMHTYSVTYRSMHCSVAHSIHRHALK